MSRQHRSQEDSEALILKVLADAGADGKVLTVAQIAGKIAASKPSAQRLLKGLVDTGSLVRARGVGRTQPPLVYALPHNAHLLPSGRRHVGHYGLSDTGTW